MIRRAWALPAAFLFLFIAPASNATSTPNAIYTLDSQVAWNIIGATGTVDAYTDQPIGGANLLCLDGGCGNPADFSNQDWIIFTVSVTSGALDQVTLGSLFEASSGLGYISGLPGLAPTSGDATSNPNSPEWLFGTQLTGTTIPLIAVFDAGDLPSAGGPFGVGATNFDLRLGGASDQFLGHVNTLVPEPGTAALLGMGLLGLGVSRRRSG